MGANKPELSIRSIVADYIRERGFDGLYDPVGECACSIIDGDGGLMPCDEPDVDNCIMGYRRVNEFHDSSDHDSCRFFVGPNRPAGKCSYDPEEVMP
jgi:hypothetical protein